MQSEQEVQFLQGHHSARQSGPEAPLRAPLEETPQSLLYIPQPRQQQASNNRDYRPEQSRHVHRLLSENFWLTPT